MLANQSALSPRRDTQSRALMASVSAMPQRRDIDAAIMIRIRDDRDRSALSEIASHYAPRLKSWLVNRGEQGATAEDIVQDVMVTVWIKAHQYDPSKASFSTWAYRLTRNKWIDHKRKHDRLQPTEPSTMQILDDRAVSGAETDYDQVEAARAVHKALAQLPIKQKEMLQLAFFEGLSHSEIAKRTGLPLGTVKSQIRGPLKKLRAHLNEYRGAYS